MAYRIDPVSILAGPLAAFALLASDTAEACPSYADPACLDSETWADIQLDQIVIPVDGVLVLSGLYRGDDVDSSLASVKVEVTLDGQPIAGALEPPPTPGVLVWRPAAPWQTSVTYQVDFGSVSDPENETGCFVPLSDTREFAADPEPGLEIGALDLSVEARFNDLPDITLESLACCEDAPSPMLVHENYLGCPGDILEFEPFQCTPTTSTGSLAIIVLGEVPPELPVRPQHLYTLVVDDEPVTSTLRSDLKPYLVHVGIAGPACARVDIHDLARGEVLRGEERCHGDEYVGQYGTHEIDELRQVQCSVLEQCAVVDETWDRTMCEPFDVPGAETDTGETDTEDAGSGSDADSGSDAGSGPEADPAADAGCGCTTNATISPAALGLVMFAVRRRRRRS